MHKSLILSSSVLLHFAVPARDGQFFFERWLVSWPFALFVFKRDDTEEEELLVTITCIFNS